MTLKRHDFCKTVPLVAILTDLQRSSVSFLVSSNFCGRIVMVRLQRLHHLDELLATSSSLEQKVIKSSEDSKIGILQAGSNMTGNGTS